MSTQSTPGIDDAGPATTRPDRTASSAGSPRHRRAARRPRRRAGRPAGREPVLDRRPDRAGAGLPDARPALGAEVALPGRRLAEQRSSTPGSATPTCWRSTTPRASTRARCPTATTRSSTRCSPATSWARSACRCTRSATDDPAINQGQWFYNLNALVLSAFARRHRRGDPRAAPPTTLGRGDVRAGPGAAGHRHGQLGPARHRAGRVRPATPGPDARPVAGRRAARPGRRGEALAAVPARAAARAGAARRPAARRAGIAVGAGGARPGCWSTCRSSMLYRESWDRFFELNTERPIDWGTLWYIGRYLDGKSAPARPATRARSSGSATNIPTLNTVSYALFGLACLGVAVLACWHRAGPGWPSWRFLVVAAFLIISKVWSQQFVLWLLPLVVLARPRGARSWPGRSPRSATSSPSTASCSARRQQAGLPGGHVRAGLDAAAGHRGGALRAGGPGDPAAGAGRGAAHLRRRPGRRRARRRAGRALDRWRRPAQRAPAEPDRRPGRPRPGPAGRHRSEPTARRRAAPPDSRRSEAEDDRVVDLLRG